MNQNNFSRAEMEQAAARTQNIREENEIDRAISRLRELDNRVSQCTAKLSDNADKLFGEEPEGEAMGCDRDGGTGLIFAVHEQISNLSEAISSLERQVSRNCRFTD